MCIEIMIDKAQKISQALLEVLESELYRNLRRLYPKQLSESARAAPMVLNLPG